MGEGQRQEFRFWCLGRRHVASVGLLAGRKGGGAGKGAVLASAAAREGHAVIAAPKVDWGGGRNIALRDGYGGAWVGHQDVEGADRADFVGRQGVTHRDFYGNAIQHF